MVLLTKPNEIFSVPAAKVERFGDKEIDLCRRMYDVSEELGINTLAATQVGTSLQVILIKDSDGFPLFFINPLIIWEHPETMDHWERNVSEPSVRYRVRPKGIKIEYSFWDKDEKEEKKDIVVMGVGASKLLQVMEFLNGGDINARRV